MTDPDPWRPGDNPDMEPCCCGHCRLDHQDMDVPEERLRRCTVTNCTCRRFTSAAQLTLTAETK